MHGLAPHIAPVTSRAEENGQPAPVQTTFTAACAATSLTTRRWTVVLEPVTENVQWIEGAGFSLTGRTL